VTVHGFLKIGIPLGSFMKGAPFIPLEGLRATSRSLSDSAADEDGGV
jgi:hypothetical protein